MTSLLGSASELMAAKVISKKGHCLSSAKNGQFAGRIKVDIQRKIRLLHPQFMDAGPYGCLYAPVFLNLIRLADPLLKYANVCGSPNLCAVAHWLITSGLDRTVLHILDLIKTAFLALSPML